MDLWWSSMISLKSCISLISRTRFECNHRMDLWYLWHLLFFLSRDIDIVSAVSQSALSKLRLPCSYCAISSCLRLLDIDNVSCLRFTVHPRDHVYFLHVSLSSLSFKMGFFLFLEQKNPMWCIIVCAMVAVTRSQTGINPNFVNPCILSWGTQVCD